MTSAEINKAIQSNTAALESYQKLLSSTIADNLAMPAFELHVIMIKRIEEASKKCCDMLISLRNLRLERYFADGLLKEDGDE